MLEDQSQVSPYVDEVTWRGVSAPRSWGNPFDWETTWHDLDIRPDIPENRKCRIYSTKGKTRWETIRAAKLIWLGMDRP